ncbi:MAG: hypothetical protein JWO86_2955, partial [Myxococcaceae bacterium]|nr:hypothetical protein [Myxococcaceae bacterium]
ILPLRQDLFRLRNDVSKALGKQVEQPRPWTPPQMQVPAGTQPSPQGYGGYNAPGGGQQYRP